MCQVLTIISAPINKEITLGLKEGDICQDSVSCLLDLWPRFLVRTDNQDLVTSYLVRKKINYFFSITNKTKNVFEA